MPEPLHHILSAMATEGKLRPMLFACADNPVPVILDDATIYSDDDQIEAMPTTFRPGKCVPVDLGAT